MNQGYVINDGEEYYCDDECLWAWYSEEEYDELCQQGLAYWTEWEEEGETEMYRNELHQILDLVLDINKSDASVFFGFSGHVDAVRIEVYENGWTPTNQPDFVEHVYVDGETDEVEKIISYLKKLKDVKTND